MSSWLVAVAIVLLITVVSNFFNAIGLLQKTGTDSVFVLIFAYEVVAIYVTILFFGKKETFPKWFIGMLIAEGVLMVFVALGGADAEAVIGVMIRVGVLIPYTLKSKRVKATFIN
jgi:hypothetical protein